MARSKFMLLVVLLALAGSAILVVSRPMRILRSQRREAFQEVTMLAAALETFFVQDTGHYPSPEEFAKGVEYNYWTPQVTIDPWGNLYQYRLLDSEGSGYELLSLGADGVQGGDGPGADIAAPSLR